jgi:hypothetical protein
MRLCLYGLTNFYFEGRKENSGLFQFGYSKEKRSDAKRISPALLTGGQGFIRHSKFYKGNISEPSTLQDVHSEMKEAGKNDVNLFESNPIAVMDAGCNKNIRRQASCTRSHKKQTGQGLLKRQAMNGRKQIWTFVRSIIKVLRYQKSVIKASLIERRAERKAEVIIASGKDGLSVETIAVITGLTADKVSEILKQYS